MASTGPYANLHITRQITTLAPHHSVFLQAGCPSCRPTNSVKALKVYLLYTTLKLAMLKLTEETTLKQHSKAILHCVSEKKRHLFVIFI